MNTIFHIKTILFLVILNLKSELHKLFFFVYAFVLWIKNVHNIGMHILFHFQFSQIDWDSIDMIT